MAHAALHFAVGLAAGMAIESPRLKAAWTQGRSLAQPVWRWLWTSWLLGAWAIIPSLARFAGFPESFCRGWWMNLFLFHPLINHWGPHGTIIGAFAFVACFVFQYAVTLAAIWKQSR